MEFAGPDTENAHVSPQTYNLSELRIHNDVAQELHHPMSNDDHDNAHELEEMDDGEGLIFVHLDELLHVGNYGEWDGPHF